jgi:hypothetical protein
MPLGAARTALLGASAGGDADTLVWLTTVDVGSTVASVSINTFAYSDYDALRITGHWIGAESESGTDFSIVQGSSWSASTQYIRGYNPSRSRTSGTGKAAYASDAHGGSVTGNPENHSWIDFYQEQRTAASQGGSFSVGPLLAGRTGYSGNQWGNYNAAWQVSNTTIYIAALSSTIEFYLHNGAEDIGAGSSFTIWGVDHS